MGKLRAFVVDKAFNVLIGAPLGAAFMAFYAYLWEFLPWQLWTGGLLVCFSATALVAVLRYDNRCKPKDRRIAEELQTSIAALDAAERLALTRFEEARLNTLEFAVDDPVIAGLLAKGVLVVASRNGNMKRGDDGRRHPVFPVMLLPLAKQLLQQRR
jgi:hypothetical protein